MNAITTNIGNSKICQPGMNWYQDHQPHQNFKTYEEVNQCDPQWR